MSESNFEDVREALKITFRTEEEVDEFKNSAERSTIFSSSFRDGHNENRPLDDYSLNAIKAVPPPVKVIQAI